MSPAFDLAALDEAAALVRHHMPETPQYCWPLLSERVCAEIWVKHENHAPSGAFKVRGGITYFDALRKRWPDCPGVVAATRGNHGQSIGFAAKRHGLPARIIVPHGNSTEKNAAMRAMGVELIEHGDDFQASLEHARHLAGETGFHFVPSFHPDLVRGVATYALELFRGVADIDVLYVPIGLGSGICGAVAARDALGLTTEVVGVTVEAAPAYAQSFAARACLSAPVAETIADGMACRVPDPEALDVIFQSVARILTVTEADLHAAIRLMFAATHNTSEGAGAAALAGAMQECEKISGKRVAIILSGGNIDSERFATVLSGGGDVQQ